MPQVTILEGGKPKSFAGVDKLQIALSGGGTSLWVPKDERLLTALTANVNGTYPPPEGYFGFDTVIVNVPPSQVAGIDPETGQYVLIGTKPSNTPTWPTTPDVPDDPWDPDTPTGDGGHDWDPWEVPDGGEWTPPWDDTDTKDEWPSEPEMTKEHIPSGIKIVKLPNKTSYIAGDDMDYTGIRVQLLDENGQPFANERYANTFIPTNELLFPVPYAPTPHGEGIKYVDDRSTIKYDSKTLYGPIEWGYSHDEMVSFNGALYDSLYLGTSTYGGALVTRPWDSSTDASQVRVTSFTDPNDGYIKYMFVAPFYFVTGGAVSAYGAGEETITPREHGASSGGVYARKVEDGCYYAVLGFMDWFDRYTSKPLGVSEYNTDLDNLARYIMFGEFKRVSGNMIPVQWVSPYDGKTYMDTFAINVSTVDSDPDGGGGGFSGGGGEGTGGEGGGGGF